MSERPRKLTPPSALVVWGCHRLTLGEKVVWYRDWSLDSGGPDGCYASPRGLSRGLGGSLTASSVATIRQRLKRLGLHVPIDRGHDADNLGWVSTLPAQCVARSARDASVLAAVLDEHIDRLEAGPTRVPDTSPSKPGFSTPPNLHTMEGAAALEGGKGGHFSVVDGEMPLPSVVTEPQKQKGVGANAPKGEKGRARLDDIQRPMNAAEMAAFEAMLEGCPPKQAAMLRRIAGVRSVA